MHLCSRLWVIPLVACICHLTFTCSSGWCSIVCQLVRAWWSQQSSCHMALHHRIQTSSLLDRKRSGSGSSILPECHLNGFVILQTLDPDHCRQILAHVNGRDLRWCLLSGRLVSACSKNGYIFHSSLTIHHSRLISG